MLLYELFLAWRSLRARPLQTSVLLIIIATAVALPITVIALGDGARQGIVRASDPFGMLVVGAKGSAQQLVLNTLLLQGVPVGNIDARIYDSLAGDARVGLVVPLAMGDNIGGARLIGTSDAFLQLRTELLAPPAFQISQGRFFAAEFEAVLGSHAAAALGLTVGDQFRAQHGVERGLSSDEHDEPYTVVGVFAPSGTSYDNVVFTSVETVWHAHELEEDEPMTTFGVGGAALDNQLTALLVRPVSFIDGNRLWQEFASGTVAQAAFPGQELGALFDLFRLAENVLSAVGALVLAMSAVMVFLTMFNAISTREQALAVMRTVGAGRGAILRTVVLESALLTLLGALVGRALGYGIAWALSAALSQQTGIAMSVRFMPSLEPAL